MSLEKVTLDNGLTIYNDRIPGERANDVTMFVPYGSVNEEPGDEGVAHVFEHCVHLETDTFKDRTDLLEYAKLNGMQTNASTIYTYTDYYANGLGLETNINHLSQILQHTHFPEEAVEHELKAVRREITTNLDSAGLAHAIATSNALFGKPYGRGVGGYHDKINFDVETLQELHDRYYKLGRMSLLVSGKAKLDEVVTLAERYFEPDAVPYDVANDRELGVTLGEHHLTGLVREDSHNVQISIGYPMSKEFRAQYDADRLPLNIANATIADACFRALRYEKGVSYDGSTSINTINHPNAWSLRGAVTTDKENVATALEVFSDIFSRDNSKYSDAAILGSLATYNYAFTRAVTSTESRLDAHESRLGSYREPVDVGLSIRRLKKTTVADIRRAIDQIVEYASIAPKYTHLTGKRDAIGEVERIIDPSEIG